MSPRVQNYCIPGPHGTIPIRSYEPAWPVKAAGLVWLHGGAFKWGGLDIPEADWVSRQLAGHGIAVISVDYRLANDGVHFPIPSDDVLAAWRWVTEEAPLGVQSDLWSLGGASAGGNLAASVSMQCRDTYRKSPRSNILIYPVMHSTLPAPSAELASRLQTLPDELRFLPELTEELNLNYLGDPRLLEHPYAFPGHGDLEKLPPTLIVNADVDDLRPSGESYARALAEADVPVTLHVETGTTHGYLYETSTTAAVHTVNRIARWLVEASPQDAGHFRDRKLRSFTQAFGKSHRQTDLRL